MVKVLIEAVNKSDWCSVCNKKLFILDFIPFCA